MSWRWKKEGNFLKSKKASSFLLQVAYLGSRIFQFAEEVGCHDKRLDLPTTEPKSTRKKITSIKVTELGRAIELPENYPLFRSYDKDDIIQKVLVRQIMKALDHNSVAALKSKAFHVNPSTTILKNLISNYRISDVESACIIASGYLSLNVEPYLKGRYIGIGGTRFLRAIKANPKLLSWKKYTKAGDILFKGEIGVLGNIQWIECNDTSSFRDDAVIFGNKGLLTKTVKPIELRVERIVRPDESIPTIAFYGIIGFIGQNIVHIPDRRRRWRK